MSDNMGWFLIFVFLLIVAGLKLTVGLLLLLALLWFIDKSES